MAVSSKVYGPALQSALSGEIAYTSATVKAMLCNNGYVPDQDNHQYKSSVTNEITGTGYTAGGVTLSSKTLTYDSATNTLSLGAAANPTWTGATFTLRYLVFYVSTGTDATSPLLSYVDFGQDVSVAGVPFVYQIPSGGFFQITASA